MQRLNATAATTKELSEIIQLHIKVIVQGKKAVHVYTFERMELCEQQNYVFSDENMYVHCK